ncbi:hypothetical protein AB205_0215240 [Aquarana catesbeiana]|nr:hypothetical protein AB205_0215240 [Aquarana catesbeiana]
MLLCTWLSSCPIAVTHFLHNAANLTAQISENLGEEEQLVQGLCALLLGICIYYNDNSLENNTKEKLKQLIEKRLGKEIFIEKLSFINKHECYSKAAQKPQPTFSNPDHMMFDHEFTKLVKELEAVIIKAVYKSSEEDKKEEEVKKSLEQHDNIISHYKNVIREQDTQLEELKQSVSSLQAKNEQLQTTVSQQLAQIQQHKDQYNVLKVQLGKDNQHHNAHNSSAQVNGFQPEEVSRLKEEIEELKKQQDLLKGELSEKNTLIQNLSSQAGSQTEQATGGSEQVSELQKEIETLRSQLYVQSSEINRLQTERMELLQKIEANATAAAPGDHAPQAKNIELEEKVASLLRELNSTKEELKSVSEERASLKQELDSVRSTAAILQDEKLKLTQEVSESKKEQDDLLILLADQDQKILSLKNKLKELGEQVEDEDDLESGDAADEDDLDDDDGREDDM